MSIVKGKNVVLTAYFNGAYIPYACAQEVVINEDVEYLLSTTVGDGKTPRYKYRSFKNNVTLSGLTFLQKAGHFVILDLFTETVRETGIDIRILFTAEDGTTQLLGGNVVIPRKGITSAAEGFSKASFDMLVNGSLTPTSLEEPPADTTPPSIVSAVIYNDNPGAVVVTFDENLNTGSTGDTAQHGLTINTKAIAFVSGAVSNFITVYISPQATVGEQLFLNYSPVGYLKDMAGNPTQAIINYPILNLVQAASTGTAYYGWRDNFAFVLPEQIEAGTPITFTLGGTIEADYRANSQFKYLWMAEPVSEPIKTKWYGSPTNNGNIGGSGDLFYTFQTIGNYRVYVTAYKTKQTQTKIQFLVN